MGGIVLDQPLPVGDLEMSDPFLLIHHWKQVLPGQQRQREVGVGPHPHRGFSPVSVVYAGEIHHRDSLGNDSIIGAGGTQWMLSGKGITHSERPSKQLAKDGGLFEFIQFWVNLPAEHKMDAPRYYPLTADDTPKYEKDGVSASIITGTFHGVKGGLNTPHDVTVVSIELDANAAFSFDLPSDQQAVMYQLDGAVSVQQGHTSFAKTLYQFGVGDETGIELKAEEKTRILLLQGKPLNEKVSQYGPFVMNNQTEIMEAIRDSQSGKMGVLIEE